MGQAQRRKNLAVLLGGALLAAHVSPVAAGLLVCLTGTAPDCCHASTAAAPSAPRAERLVDAAGCDCCIAVDALPSSVGASTQKSGLDVVTGPAQLENALLPCPTRVARAPAASGSDSRLASLRTVVLLI